MPDHDEKIMSALQEHVSTNTGKPAPGTEDPKLVQKDRPGSTTDQTADLRDSVSLLVGGGYTSLSDPDARANYSRMVSIMGKERAQNMLTHIVLQNSRTGWDKMKPEERVGKFYDINSSHGPTDETIQQIKSFGSGPLAGYTDSINLINQHQQGNTDFERLAKTQTGSSEKK